MYSIKELTCINTKDLINMRDSAREVISQLSGKKLTAHQKALATVAAINIRRINKALAYKDARYQYYKL